MEIDRFKTTIDVNLVSENEGKKMKATKMRRMGRIAREKNGYEGNVRTNNIVMRFMNP